MKHDTQIEAAFQIPDWSTPGEARERLDQEIDNFVTAAAAATAEPDAALALRVTAGLGKTATALRVIARHGEALLARGHVLIYVPTLDLAERADEEFRSLAPRLPSRVIRGRDAQRPDDCEKKMCDRAELAREISGFVPSVTQALCRGQDPDDNFVQSPCASGCPYLRQKDVPGPHVVLLSHAYLTVDPPIDRDFPIALRVIDEKVWPTLIRTSHLSIEDLMRAPTNLFPNGLYGNLSRATAALVDGLQRGLPLHDHLRSSGIDTEQLQELVRAEDRSRSSLEIGPWQSAEAVKFRVANFDTRSFVASKRRRRIFDSLSGKEAGHCVGLNLAEVTTEHGSQRMIMCSRMEAVAREAPLLLLDADVDRDITERVAPGADFISIQSPPIADIVQVSDRTLSGSWLLDLNEGARRRAGVLTILRHEVDKAAGGGVLVVATKAVLSALHRDLGRSIAKGDDDGLRQPLLGAKPRWFGPRTQGVNDYENYTTIVVIGRLQPGITDIETSARAVFAQDTLPITRHVSGPLPAVASRFLMADGSAREADLRAHPDPRVQAILAQSRECATLQAIARLRLVTPSHRKRVVILSSLPLPEFPITRVVPFAALVRGLDEEPDWPGFERMEKAMRATMGRPVRGARLSARGLTEDLPLDFPTEDAAKGFRKGRTSNHMMTLCERISRANGWPMVALSLKRPGGGKSTPAFILETHGDPLHHAKELWPDLTPFLA
ncbi:DEAD/DEAH box helicase family protein [Palleronia pelagia]|uniref:Type III restriction enzyme, res subunit n=1 Tax=Palleronia pelagia TaxID=387096 RepID=A0A1H8BE82_9RHOB|nr:DEAD/DEAH box helicase family protein [Palleronia pelagia]SEM81056.1 Type III restriction enzyme, res subunit [Palleronia pelagia]